VARGGERKVSQTFVAVLFMGGTIVAFTSMAVAGRAVSSELDTFEIMMYRSFIGFVLVMTIGGALGRLRDIRRARMGTHAVRNIGHFAGQNLWFFAITAIPLAQVFALEFTMPLWVMMLSLFVLGERITRVRALAALIGFAGILVVARPSPSTFDWGLVAAAASAVGFAISAVYTRLLTRTESTISILFWLTVMQAGFGVLFSFADGDVAVPPLAILPWLVIIAGAGLFAHWCLTNALARAPATVVMPIDFVRLPVIALVGVMLYQEPIDAFLVLGGAMIFAGNYLNVASETRAARHSLGGNG